MLLELRRFCLVCISEQNGVLTELGVTLQTCTSCHAAWKQQVVDEPTWTRLTSSAPPTHGAAH